jgi:hypothetical protein|eukprot:g1545.t1
MASTKPSSSSKEVEKKQRPNTWAYYVERSLGRWGGWGKKLAFVGYVHQALGDMKPLQSAALFGCSTFVSVLKILHDFHEPHGTRLYVANLAGDDAAVLRIRGQSKPVPWADCTKFLKDSGHTSFLQKALDSGSWSFYRNIQNGTLSAYWAYSIGWRFYAYLLNRHKGLGFLRTLFPRGVMNFAIGQLRTCGLLFSFGFWFWMSLGMASKYKITKDGLTKNLTALFVTIAALIALPMERRGRWKALAAFMTMTIMD